MLKLEAVGQVHELLAGEQVEPATIEESG